ncbi:MAG: chemotaxis protein CheB [Candidatus Auribacterota bacterium]|jgi:two-component system chemotaxis response regulator CheB|nr:chemotaxis protein CheB [Candidatus Auribacterota bacterium]
MTTQKYTLIIVDEHTPLTTQINDYFRTYFPVQSVLTVSSLNEIGVDSFQNSLVLINANRFIETNEIVSMAQLIKKHSISVIPYFEPDFDDMGTVLDSIELGAVDAVSSCIFSSGPGCSDSERVAFNGFINSLFENQLNFDIDLLRLRLYPFANEDITVQTKKNRSLVVIGSDFGGISTILGLIPQFPASYKNSFCVLMNGNNRLMEALVDRLQVNSSLKVRLVRRAMVIESSTVYVIAANRTPVLDSWDGKNISILVNDALPFEISLKHWIDPFMFSAAEIYGKNTVGILLGGLQEDGILGLEKIKEHKGTTIIQSNKSYPSNMRLKIARKKNCAQKIVYAGDMAKEIMQL